MSLDASLETRWRIERSSRRETWRTSGHLVPDPAGTVRVLEMDRTIPTKSRAVRLHRDGAIERGAELRDCLCSAPVVLDDGTLVFVDLGHVRAVDRALVARDLLELTAVDVRDGYRFRARVARHADRIVVALSERLPESEQPQGPGRTAARHALSHAPSRPHGTRRGRIRTIGVCPGRNR